MLGLHRPCLVSQSEHNESLSRLLHGDAILWVLLSNSSSVLSGWKSLSILTNPLVLEKERAPAVLFLVLSANVNCVELLGEIVEVHPENTVIVEFGLANDILDSLGPEIGVV